jgi:mono/diheme cytochrome c family protein
LPGCHTEEKTGRGALRGRRALKTPFGTFYGPNITPHRKPASGVERSGFRARMREGRAPDGANLFPAFPYPSFTKISDADLRDLWAYLRSLPPSATRSQAARARFLLPLALSRRYLEVALLHAGRVRADTAKSEALNRGAYLVQALGHCGECHTPRNFLAAPKKDRFLAGASSARTAVPNITPTRLKKVSDASCKEVLQTGDDLRRGRARRVDGRGGAQHHQPAHGRRPRTR